MAADDRFRRQLAGALDRWVSEGLIEPDQRQKFRRYYQLDALDSSSGGRFAVILLLLGATLVGLGIVVFVAANWQVIPRSVRALGSLALLVGLQGSGFRFWQRGEQWLGSTLLLVGQFALGASIGLMAQWFQVSGHVSGLFWAWGLGVLAMAYGLRHAFSAALAGILLTIAYIWGGSWLEATWTAPWLALLLYLPLAYWCRSRWVFALGAMGFGAAVVGLPFEAWQQVDSNIDEILLYLAALANLTAGISLWGWSLQHQRWQVRSALEGLDFAPIAQLLGLLGLLGLVYGLSFGFVWVQLDTLSLGSGALGLWAAIPPLGLSGATLVVLLAGSLVLWARNLNTWNRDPLSVAVLVTCLTLLVLLHTGALWGLSLLIVNLLLFGLGGAITWQGLQRAQRWQFWLGLLTLTGLVLSRFFEYDTGLLLKALALVVCGIGVIVAGLRFERSMALR